MQVNLGTMKSRAERNKEDRERRILNNGLEAERARSNEAAKRSYIPSSQLSEYMRCVMRKQTFRSLSLSYQKKDGSINSSCGGLVVKASGSQLGGRWFESRTDEAGWLATS